MAEADLSVFSDGAGDAETLQTDTDCGCGVSGLLAALLDGDCSADGICPDSVLESDGLGASYDFIAVDALCKGYVLAFFDGIDAVLFKYA